MCMSKRRDIDKTLRRWAKAHDLELSIVHGSSHDKVQLGGRISVIPRHKEINEITTKQIYKQLGVEP